MENQFSNIDNTYKELIAKVLSEKASSEEIALLNQWIGQDASHKVYYNQMKETWQISSLGQKNSRFDSEKAWEKAQAAINPDSGHNSFVIQLRKFTRIAAIITLGFLLGGAATFWGVRRISHQPVAANTINEVSAPLGGKSKLVLPDGTVVWLNAGSTLKYAQDYNTSHRDVYLEGEAYFKVKTNPEKPFIVKTSEMSVKAYGTSFNVKAYPDEGTITTTLVEGIVRIEGTDKNKKKFEVALKPNQKLTYVRKEVEPKEEIEIVQKVQEFRPSENTELPVENVPVVVDKEVETNLYTSWKDEKWVIEREDLDELCVMLERRYNVKFIYKTDSIKKYKISGTIRKETLEQILDFLKLMAPVEYTIKDGLVTLNLDKKRTENYLKVMN